MPGPDAVSVQQSTAEKLGGRDAAKVAVLRFGLQEQAAEAYDCGCSGWGLCKDWVRWFHSGLLVVKE